MNIHKAGSNLSATSTFEQNMNDLTSSLNTTFGGLRMFKQADKSIKKPTSYGKPSNSESSLVETSTAPSPTRLYTGSSVTSSSSSFSSSSSTTNLVLSLSFLSLTSPAEEEATDNHLSRRLIQSSALQVPAVSYSTEASGGIGANSALVTHATKSESTVSPTNKVKGSMQLDSDDASLSTLSNILLEPEEVQVANRRDKENTLLNQDFNDDEGFASGDESTDDNEPDNDNPGLNLSLTNRNITETKDNKVGIDGSQGRVDNRLFNATVDGDTIFGFVERMEELESMPFNATWYNENSSTYDRNDSTYNDTYVLVAEGMYPSGYSLLQIVLASIAATVLMVVVVVGNMLVIIAIATEKALKNIQNWFIASLAVADFFLGLVIMPFSLANEIMGYWIFGYLWCDIYSAMDVLLCTASIMNLCLISLDRFWSITQAIEYLKKRTPARAALMITLVWLLSALVCIPPLLGWKRPQPAEEYPKCSLSEDIGYVLYSALGSFYIPSCIMVFVYIKIYFAAKARARRGIRKQPRPRVVIPPESPDIRQTSFTQSTPATDSRKTPGTMDNVATIENQPVMIPIVTCDFASDVSTSEADPGGGDSLALEEKDTLKVTMPMLMQKTNLKASLSVNGSGDTAVSSLPPRCRAPSVGIDVDMVSEFDPSSSDSGVVSRCAVVKPLKLRLCRPIFGRKAIGKLKREHADPGKHSAKDTQEDTKPPKPRDPEREKKRLARKKEKRATLILGLIMGSFIVCWLPFFFLYIVKPVFPSLEIPAQASAIAFWLGYMNSALNPVIYTVFNKDFRRAFRRILYK